MHVARFGNTAQPVQIDRNLAIQNFNRTQGLVSRYLDYMEERHGPNSYSSTSHISYASPELLANLAKASGVGTYTPGWSVTA